MIRNAIVAGSGMVSVLVAAFVMTRAPEPADLPGTPEPAPPAARQMAETDLIAPVFTDGSVAGYIVANVTGTLAPDIEEKVAVWYLNDALLQLLHDAPEIPRETDETPESAWLRDRLEAAANRRYAAPLVRDLAVSRIKYLKRI